MQFPCSYHFAIPIPFISFFLDFSTCWRAGASQPSRTSGSDFSYIYIYRGAAHTVIPIQRQHAHKIVISVYTYNYTLVTKYGSTLYIGMTMV